MQHSPLHPGEGNAESLQQLRLLEQDPPSRMQQRRVPVGNSASQVIGWQHATVEQG
jgi:hypothetical protein